MPCIHYSMNSIHSSIFISHSSVINIINRIFFSRLMHWFLICQSNVVYSLVVFTFNVLQIYVLPVKLLNGCHFCSRREASNFKRRALWGNHFLPLGVKSESRWWLSESMVGNQWSESVLVENNWEAGWGGATEEDVDLRSTLFRFDAIWKNKTSSQSIVRCQSTVRHASWIVCHPPCTLHHAPWASSCRSCKSFFQLLWWRRIILNFRTF